MLEPFLNKKETSLFADVNFKIMRPYVVCEVGNIFLKASSTTPKKNLKYTN